MVYRNKERLLFAVRPTVCLSDCPVQLKNGKQNWREYSSWAVWLARLR